MRIACESAWQDLQVSDGAHNLGFSQYATIFHPVSEFREYSDKMASYLFGKNFFKNIINKNEKNDVIFDLLKKINRNDILAGGIRPHLYCLPIAKRDKHRQALREAVTSGNDSFFLGSDSAPHLKSAKETDCGCAGIFNAANAIEVYANVFDEMNSLDYFEGFSSLNGPKFYGLETNDSTITLEQKVHPAIGNVNLPCGEEVIRPFLSEEELNWLVVDC